MKDLKDQTFQELVDEMTRQAHDGLLTGGGKGLRLAIFGAMGVAMEWRREQDKKEKESKK
jgi:hypothetical protein